MMIKVAFFVAFSAWSTFIYTAGINHQKVKIEKAADKAFSSQLEKKQIELSEAVKHQKEWRKKAIELQSRKPKVVVKYVEKIIDNNISCNRIVGFDQLWHQLSQNFQSKSVKAN